VDRAHSVAEPGADDAGRAQSNGMWERPYWNARVTYSSSAAPKSGSSAFR
jgi:hypothetical protein